MNKLFLIFPVLLLIACNGSGEKAPEKREQKWDVLITDPLELIDRNFATNNESVVFSFNDDFVRLDKFTKAEKYQKYDAIIEINEKVLSNRQAYVFYREKPSKKMQNEIAQQCERAIREAFLSEYPDLEEERLKKIFPIKFLFFDVIDPHSGPL